MNITLYLYIPYMEHIIKVLSKTNHHGTFCYYRKWAVGPCHCVFWLAALLSHLGWLRLARKIEQALCHSYATPKRFWCKRPPMGEINPKEKQKLDDRRRFKSWWAEVQVEHFWVTCESICASVVFVFRLPVFSSQEWIALGVASSNQEPKKIRCVATRCGAYYHVLAMTPAASENVDVSRSTCTSSRL